jgi:signal transduction histidine kinase
VLEDVTRLRQLDRLKDDFISVASHELRTPLTSLQMAVQLLMEGSAGVLTAPQERLLRMAAIDADRLDRLTKDLLDLTRLEAGTAVPNRRPIRPADMVDLALRALRPQIEAKQVTLEVHVTPSVPLVSGDLEQLSRVVSNLVGNALRHTPAGGRIEVAAAIRNEKRGARNEERERRPVPDPIPRSSSLVPSIEFTVTDNGEGISPDYLEQVFERFVQVPGTSAGGAGLGLPIARRIVEAHGGSIGVESTLSERTRFYFTVPVAATES